MAEERRGNEQSYEEHVKKFVDEGKVDEAAERAKRAVEDPKKREELKRAEKKGKERARH